MIKLTLKERANRAGLTVVKLSKKLQISIPSLYKIFKLDKSVKLEYLIKYARVMKVKIIIDKKGVRYE